MKTLKEADYIKAWLIFFFVATVGGGILGAIIGAFLGGGLSIAGFSLTQIKIICGLAGLMVGIPISYFTFRTVIAKFLLPRLREANPPPSA